MYAVRSCGRLSLALGASLFFFLPACAQGGAPGTLVGKYAVRGVLTENTCGSGLSPVNPLTFDVQLRHDDGVGYWTQGKNAANTGTLQADGSFRFTTSQTQVVSQGSPQQNLQPSDFVRSPDSNFDLAQGAGCALTVTETITGTLRRWNHLEGAVVPAAESGDDMSGSDTITVAPSSGSNCDATLAAYGGNFAALPCQVHYTLRGTLDTSKVPAAQTGAGGSASAGAGGGTADAGEADASSD